MFTKEDLDKQTLEALDEARRMTNPVAMVNPIADILKMIKRETSKDANKKRIT